MNPGCLFVLDNLGVGGSERKTIVVANRLAERGREVHLAFLNASYDVTGTLHPAIKYFVAGRKGKLDLRVVRMLRGYVHAQNIGTVWAVNLYPMLYAHLALRPYRNKIRLVGSTNITLFRNVYEQLKMHIYLPIIRRLDTFVYGSYGQMDLWKKRYKLGTAVVTVIHNGVDTEHFSTDRCRLGQVEARKQFSLSADSIVLGTVAQFRVEKAQGDLVKAVQALRGRGYHVQALLVGDGRERASVESLVRERGLSEHVRFVGQLDDVRPALAAMDVFVLTSVAVETFSNAALEAMSMGRPSVLSDIGGAREMIIDGHNGYVYMPGNVAELTRQLEKLMGREEIKRMAVNARRAVVEKFSAAAMADRYESVIWGKDTAPAA